MRGPGRHNLTELLVDLTACFAIPAYTLLFAGDIEWLGTNFSVLAVAGQASYRGFFFWGLLAGGYFLLTLAGVGRTLPRRRDRLMFCLLILAASGCLGAGLTVPYLPGDDPERARLHVLLCFGAGVLLMAGVLTALLALRRGEPARYRPLLALWWAIAAGAVGLFLLAGQVSSALEIFFTLSAALLVRNLWRLRRLER